MYSQSMNYTFLLQYCTYFSYKSMEDRAAVRQRCAQDPELSQCGMYVMLYC